MSSLFTAGAEMTPVEGAVWRVMVGLSPQCVNGTCWKCGDRQLAAKSDWSEVPLLGPERCSRLDLLGSLVVMTLALKSRVSYLTAVLTT